MKIEVDVMESVLGVITDYAKLSDNKCGIRPNDVSGKLNKAYYEIKPYLNNLHKQNKIMIRRGINSQLIFIK